jgi:hypothetical protein
MIRLANLNTHQVHQYARLLAAEAALNDGAPEVALMILADTTIKVKSRRTTGSWQFDKGIQEFDGTAAVVFADLSAKQPSFRVVPSGWLRRDITARHAQAFPTGVRPVNPDSLHAAVNLEHIQQWGQQWRNYVNPADGTAPRKEVK